MMGRGAEKEGENTCIIQLCENSSMLHYCKIFRLIFEHLGTPKISVAGRNLMLVNAYMTILLISSIISSLLFVHTFLCDVGSLCSAVLYSQVKIDL